MTANYSYYLKQVKGDNGWNPFNGIMPWWRVALDMFIYLFLTLAATLWLRWMLQ